MGLYTVNDLIYMAHDILSINETSLPLSSTSFKP